MTRFIDWPKALIAVYPDAIWTLHDDDIDNIEWFNDYPLDRASLDRAARVLFPDVTKRVIVADGDDQTVITVPDAEFPETFAFEVLLDGQHYAEGTLEAGFGWQIALAVSVAGVYEVLITDAVLGITGRTRIEAVHNA